MTFCWSLRIEVELQKLVDRLDRVNREYSLLTNVDKIEVMDGQHQYVDRTPVEESIRMTEDGDKWRK